MTAAPLGALAEVIVEQFGELIEAAIAGADSRRAPLSSLDVVVAPAPERVRLSSNELAAMHIQPGNWVAVGRIENIQPRTLIEINLSTWEWRETLEPAALRDSLMRDPGDSADLPPAARQAAS